MTKIRKYNTEEPFYGDYASRIQPQVLRNTNGIANLVLYSNRESHTALLTICHNMRGNGDENNNKIRILMSLSNLNLSVEGT